MIKKSKKIISKFMHSIAYEAEPKNLIFARWVNDSELKSEWDERTLILASFLDLNSSVLEFGAGNQILRKYGFKKYYAHDIVKRNNLTIVFDLNSSDNNFSFPDTVDSVIISGVIEYIVDIENFFSSMDARVDFVAVSYCTVDLLVCAETRKASGFANNLSKKELEKIFSKKYEIVINKGWNLHELYLLKRKHI